MTDDGSPSVTARIAARLLRWRRFTRAPVWIFRARAGAVFGSRVLMLEHTGRKSGARRFAVSASGPKSGRNDGK
ncbi:hypothetical protein BN971_01276 [Mycobacterium bohemicum DSM 44277]|uniref:Uncharacterized protein n=1 Tax=Mycobacterium bohemicum DSM 44277 TaxID=1236609 RepID=A0A0U0W6R2_MYCBE|nr:hypothetical protein BN971_01276 [Mycobacterium bohemicum DSM 44277]